MASERCGSIWKSFTSVQPNLEHQSSSHGGFGIRLVLEKLCERAPRRIDRASPKASQLHPISRSSSSFPPSCRKPSQKHTTDARCGRARRTAATPGRNREHTIVLGKETAWTEAAPGNESRGLGSAEKEATQTTSTLEGSGGEERRL